MSRYTTSYSSIGYPRWTRAVKIRSSRARSRFSFKSSVGPLFTDKFGLTPWDVTNKGYIWQLVTYIFLHDTGKHPAHPFQHARPLDVRLGVWNRYGARGSSRRFFFVCGIGAAILMVFSSSSSGGGDPRVTTIGASGAIYGILLAFGMLFPDRIIIWMIFPIPAKYLVMILGGIAFFSSLSASSGGIAHVAHLGGMLCGYVYIKSRGLVRRRTEESSRSGCRDLYGKWQRKRLRRKFDVYYNRRHGNGDASDQTRKWRRWKN